MDQWACDTFPATFIELIGTELFEKAIIFLLTVNNTGKKCHKSKEKSISLLQILIYCHLILARNSY
jgi:hypothetical protein